MNKEYEQETDEKLQKFILKAYGSQLLLSHIFCIILWIIPLIAYGVMHAILLESMLARIMVIVYLFGLFCNAIAKGDNPIVSFQFIFKYIKWRREKL